MDKVYIISQYKAPTEMEMEFNRKVTRHFCREIVLEGKIPVAPHLFYTQFLNEYQEKERQVGLSLGLKELHEADEFLMIVIDGRISEGMYWEIWQAIKEEMCGRALYFTSKKIMEVVG